MGRRVIATVRKLPQLGIIKGELVLRPERNAIWFGPDPDEPSIPRAVEIELRKALAVVDEGLHHDSPQREGDRHRLVGRKAVTFTILSNDEILLVDERLARDADGMPLSRIGGKPDGNIGSYFLILPEPGPDPVGEIRDSREGLVESE